MSQVVFSIVFHLKKVSPKNSHRIKSYSCFKTGYKWRHLLPVYLVLEGFLEVTAEERVGNLNKSLGDLLKGLALRFDKYLVQDHQHVVGLDMGIIFMYDICLYGMAPGARDAADGHVFVAGVGFVGRRGPGPSP